MISRLGTCVAFVAIVAACGGDTVTPPEPSATSSPTPGIVAGQVTLDISTEGGAVGGETLVTVTLTNGTDATVTLVRPRWIPNFVKFTVIDSDGSPMPFYGPHSLLKALGEEGFVTVEPGQSTSEVLDLERGFQLDAGSYTVFAEYRNAAEGSHEGGRALIFEHGDGPVSPTIELVVAP